MDNPTRWNITNSAQNIVSALVDPSKQFDHAFRREWSNSFSSFSRFHKLTVRGKQDNEFKAKLQDYLGKLEERKYIKKCEAGTVPIGSLNISDDNSKIREQPCSNISLIPNVFMQEDFDLSNLKTFTEVINASSDCLYAADGLNKKNSSKYDNNDDVDEDDMSELTSTHFFTKRKLKELQSNFTDYLDIIEEKLASQISNRSGDFFQVMSSVDSVMEELSLAIKSVTNLRKRCSLLNESLVTPKMKNVCLIKTRDNAKNTLDKMKDIAYLCKVQHMIQLLLSASDYSGALDLIEKSRTLLHNDLTSVVCLKHLESQLVEVERVIGLMMFQEFGFATGFSEISERNSLTLLSVLQTQAEKFVNEFHEERKKRIETNLDGEQWKMVDSVPQDFQRLISLLVDENKSISEIFTSANKKQHLKTHSRTPSDATANQDSLSGNMIMDDLKNGLDNISISSGITTPNQQNVVATNDVGLSPIRSSRQNGSTGGHVLAGGRSYVIVNSVITLVQIVMDYCKCAHDIRSLSSDLLERLFTILRLYNSKTYHLVYSAGAIQVAGLKTITTRRLFVSQRSLKLMILLIPAIKKHFSNLLNEDTRLRRFDEIRLAYEEHAGKIPERVISIVKDVIEVQLEEWDAKPPVPSTQFTAIAQHLMRLHDNIQDVLPPDELRSLFLLISQTFKDVLITHLKRLNINNETGPQQWIVTQELTFYKMSSAKLSVFKGLELNFDDIWTRLNSIKLTASAVTTSPSPPLPVTVTSPAPAPASHHPPPPTHPPDSS